MAEARSQLGKQREALAFAIAAQSSALSSSEAAETAENIIKRIDTGIQILHTYLRDTVPASLRADYSKLLYFHFNAVRRHASYTDFDGSGCMFVTDSSGEVNHLIDYPFVRSWKDISDTHLFYQRMEFRISLRSLKSS